MHELDINNPQSTDQVDAAINGLAGGIMDVLDNTGEEEAAVVTPKEEAAEQEQQTEIQREETQETETQQEQKVTPETDKYTIKWQGQDKEVSQEELISLAQQGFDYTQKTQALSRERDELAPAAGLAKKIKDDPVFASVIANYLQGNATPQKQEVKTPQFDDPIEQLKYEAKQEALAEMRKEFQQTISPLQHMTVLNQVRNEVQRDPDYAEIHQQIVDMVQASPPALQKTLYMQLDQDPTAYKEAFQFFKSKKVTAKPEAQKQTTTQAQIVKKETKAPILDGGGVATPDIIRTKERQQKLSKQKADAIRSGDDMALASFFQASGALDHLY